MLPQPRAPLPLQPLEAQVVAGWYNLEAEQVIQGLEMNDLSVRFLLR